MMPLSPRSIPTGPGSRGGHGHTTRQRLALDPTYWQRWREAHPEYRERERLRWNRRDRRTLRTVRVSDVAKAIVREEAERTTFRAVADRLAFDPSGLYRWLRGDSLGHTHLIDTIAETYGWKRLAQTRAALRRAA